MTQAVQEPTVWPIPLNADLRQIPPVDLILHNFLYMCKDKIDTEEPVSTNADKRWPSTVMWTQFCGLEGGIFGEDTTSAAQPPRTASTCFPEEEEM